MNAPLKNVTTEDLEKTIAEALQRYCAEGHSLTVAVNELVFDEALTRVDIKLSAWSQLTSNPFMTRT